MYISTKKLKKSTQSFGKMIKRQKSGFSKLNKRLAGYSFKTSAAKNIGGTLGNLPF